MLYIITSSFPFGGEPFLETEALFHGEQTMYIVQNPQTKLQNKSLKNIKTYILSNKNKRLWYIFYLSTSFFDYVFRKELKYLIKKKKLSIQSFIQMLKNYCYSRFCVRQIDALVKKNNPDNKQQDILYSYWMVSHAITAAMLKRKYKTIKFITRCHGYDLYEERYDYHYLPFREFIFDRADLILPISQDGKNYLLNHYPAIEKSKIHISRLGTRRFDRLKIPKKLNKRNKKFSKVSSVIEKREVGKDRYLVVSCSNIIPLKRVDVMIKSLSLVKESIFWVHFGDGSERAEIEKLAKRVLPENIQFYFAGKVMNQELLSFYSSLKIDLFLNTSLFEGIPVSIMEAMSYSIPVIATNVGGNSEIVMNDYNGFLIEKDFTYQNLARTIEIYLKKSETEKEKYRNQAYLTWKKFYNADENYQKLTELIRNLS